jgi:hypothetical protein
MVIRSNLALSHVLILCGVVRSALIIKTMKTVFLFAVSPKREQTEFIKELPFPLYPTGIIELEDGSQYQIQLIETCIETGYINVYLRD